MNDDPKPIGYYWYIWAGGEKPDRAKKEFYAIRKLPHQTSDRQVLVKSLGSLVWINMPLDSLFFYNRRESQ